MPHLQPAANLYIHNRIRWQMNGSIPPHLPQSIRQPKSGQMAGVQWCGRSPATVFPMIINQLEARCRSAGVLANIWNIGGKRLKCLSLDTLQIRQDVFKIRLDKIKKRQEKNKIPLDVFMLLVSPACETYFIDQRSLLRWPTQQVSLTHETARGACGRGNTLRTIIIISL